ncbi:MAG: hypothetical protein IT379_13505 [Deltaproteobacteria bacterium]|nr:hypothetical protein [Deltaproteobacteria bacterium]
MADGWIDLDDVERSAMPEWTRKDERLCGVVLSEHGIALLDGKRGSVATWGEVLGVAVVESEGWMPHVFVLVPRRPPRPPWFAVTAAMLPDAMRDEGLERFAFVIKGRSSAWGYRRALADRARMPMDELVRRVMARKEVPGAVEIPVGSPGAGKLRFGTVGLAAAGSGGMAAYMAGLIAAPALAGPSALVALGVVGALTLGATYAGATLALFGGMPSRKSRRKQRVLVLAPDGCVCGFYEGVRAMGWDQVASFQIGELRGQPCLAVMGHRPQDVGRVEGHWFSQPLELIVAVAEAYRKCATTTL